MWLILLDPQYLEIHMVTLKIILNIKTVNLHFFPHHQFVSSLTATLVFIRQIHVVPAAEKSHLVTARPQFVGDTALHVGRVAGN